MHGLSEGAGTLAPSRFGRARGAPINGTIPPPNPPCTPVGTTLGALSPCSGCSLPENLKAMHFWDFLPRLPVLRAEGAGQKPPASCPPPGTTPEWFPEGWELFAPELQEPTADKRHQKEGNGDFAELGARKGEILGTGKGAVKHEEAEACSGRPRCAGRRKQQEEGCPCPCLASGLLRGLDRAGWAPGHRPEPGVPPGRACLWSWCCWRTGALRPSPAQSQLPAFWQRISGTHGF